MPFLSLTFAAALTISGALADLEPTALVAPSGLTAKATSANTVVLAWKDNSTKETSFRIERKAGTCTSFNAWAEIGTVGKNVATYTSGGLKANTTYSYQVRAHNEIEDSFYSNCKSAKTAPTGTPQAPTGLVAKAITPSIIDLRWADNSSNESEFRIWRKEGAGSFSLLKTTGNNIRYVRDSDATGNESTTPYYYYLQACNDSGCSPSTNTALLPFKPTGLTVVASSGPQADLQWKDASSKETSMLVERKPGKCEEAGAWAQIEELPAHTVTYSDAAVEAGKTYSYRVRGKIQSAARPYASGVSMNSNCSDIAFSGGGTVSLPETGQKTCYSAEGVQLPSCKDTGQDGDIQAGVEWPPTRFSPAGSPADCMVDRLTGLMWPKVANLHAPQYWADAVDWANQLSYCGHDDWHLPNINELKSLLNEGVKDIPAWLVAQGFTSVPWYYYYWSSTTDASATTDAWYVNMRYADVSFYSKDGGGNYAWPVRDGRGYLQTGKPAVELPKTGQTTSYAVGDDGDLEKGAAWPQPRFTITYCDASGPCANQTADCDNNAATDVVLDNLTGLTWRRDATATGPKDSFWQDGLNAVSTLSVCGLASWRMPNKNELFSLVDRGKAGVALPFVNVKTDQEYWTSTTAVPGTSIGSYAWVTDMWRGWGADRDKDWWYAYTWPVRGGR
jgi:hypothetical protein